MSLQPISRQRHGSQRWRRAGDFRFASTSAFVTLAAAEVPKAALALPLAFVEREAGWALIAVLGLVPGKNLYVDDQGRWAGSYIPAAFRAYPFRLGRTETGEELLCIDEGAGLVEGGLSGETFFDEAGVLSPAVAQVRDFLAETAQSEAVVSNASLTLHAAGVIAPWPVTVQEENGSRSVAGLHRIDEAALNNLDDAAFGALRHAGLLGLAYAQLLSMANLSNLGQLAQARAQAEAAERARAEIKPMITLPEDNTIDWDWSKIGR